MSQEWIVEQPQTLDVEGVAALALRLIAGEVDVVTHSADGPAGRSGRVEVHSVDGQPLRISVDDGRLSVVHERLTWGGLLTFFGSSRARAHVSVSIPRDCPVELGVVSADATVTGVAGSTSVRSVSGDITLDGCLGEITAESVSGRLEARAVDGRLSFTSVSGELTVVEGAPSALQAKTVSGGIVLDLAHTSGAIDLKTVSGELMLRLPSKASFQVDARSVSGALTAQGLDGVVRERGPGKASMSGTLGSGEHVLRAKTVSGDVTLLRSTP